MKGFFLRRLAVVIPTVIGAVTLVFFFLHMIPGDPVEVMLGETAQQADKERLRQELGLNQPLYVQYGRFMAGIVQGDLGGSYFYRRPVAQVIAERVPATVELALAAFIVAGLIAIPLGIIAALREGTAVDNAAVLFSLVGVSLPNFWLGPLLIILFSIKLGWLPVSGKAGVASLVLPAITLGAAFAAILSRMTRASLLERLGEDYLMVAQGKGSARVEGDPEARPAQCLDPHHHGDGVADRRPLVRGHHHGKCLFVAGDRDPPHQRDRGEGLPPGSGMHSLHQPELCTRQPPDRPLLRVGGSPDPIEGLNRVG